MTRRGKRHDRRWLAAESEGTARQRRAISVCEHRIEWLYPSRAIVRLEEFCHVSKKPRKSDGRPAWLRKLVQKEAGADGEARVRTAAHEAGHAVADVLLDRPFRDVSMRVQRTPEKLPDGRATVRVFTVGVTDEDCVRNQARVERNSALLDLRLLVSSMAGMMAEAMHDETIASPYDHELLDAGETDLAYMDCVIASVPRGRRHSASDKDDQAFRGALYRWASRRALFLLMDHWAAVAAVANALLERETLTWAEVREMVSAVDRSPSAPAGVADSDPE